MSREMAEARRIRLEQVKAERIALTEAAHEEFQFQEIHEPYARAFAVNVEAAQRRETGHIPQGVAFVLAKGILLPPGYESLALEMSALSMLENIDRSGGLYSEVLQTISLGEYGGALMSTLPDAALLLRSMNDFAAIEDKRLDDPTYLSTSCGVPLSPGSIFLQTCLEQRYPIHTHALAAVYKGVFREEFCAYGAGYWGKAGALGKIIDAAFLNLYGERGSMYRCEEVFRQIIIEHIEKIPKEKIFPPVPEKGIMQEAQAKLRQYFDLLYEYSQDTSFPGWKEACIKRNGSIYREIREAIKDYERTTHITSAVFFRYVQEVKHLLYVLLRLEEEKR